MTCRFLNLALLSTALAACTPQDDDADSEASTGSATDSATAPTSSGSGTDTGSADPACACIDPEKPGQFSYTCPLSACGSVDLSCNGGDGEGPSCYGDQAPTVIDEAALDCSLDLLITRVGGVVEYHTLIDEAGGSSYSGGFLEFKGDKALTRTYGGHDATSQESAAGFVTIKPIAYFEGCKAEPDLAKRFDCFTAWSDEQPAADCDGPDEVSENF